MDGHGALEGTMGRKERKQEVSGAEWICISKKKKKMNGGERKKGKRASRNYTTHWFSRGGKATTKSSNNTTKKCNNIIKWNAVVGLMPVASPERKKKWVAIERNCIKRGSGTEKNLQKTRCVKVNNMATEIDEGIRKIIK